MFRVVIVLALIGVILFFLFGKWFRTTPAQQVAAALRRVLLGAVVVLLLFLTVTGRLPWVFAVLGGLLPLIQRLFVIYRQARVLKGRFGGRGGSVRGGGQTSKVETDYLRMYLDHSSGALSGVVLAGSLDGRRLEDLSRAQLMTLLSECHRHDEEGARLLETYLDRTFGPEWRETEDYAGHQERGGSSGPMTAQEAYDILGLEPGADEKAIRDAHRRLMQKLHPDRGGSTYLAAKINEAKDVLMGR